MKKTGIITALISEARSIAHSKAEPDVIELLNGHICILVCGMGRERARDAAQKLAVHGCEGLISWGTAGALHKDIIPGALIIPESVITDDNEIIPTTGHWRRKLVKALNDCPSDIYSGPLSDSMQVLTSSRSKFEARQQNDAIAVDMESASIAQVARNENIPFLAIRAISDSADMSIPESILSYTDPYGNIQLSRLINALSKRPGDIPDIIKLGFGFRAAKSTLRWSAKKIVKLLSDDTIY